MSPPFDKAEDSSNSSTLKIRSFPFWFSVAGAVILSIAVLSIWTVQRTSGSAEMRKQTLSVILRAEQVLSQLKDAETGQRGYLLTGDARYLEPYSAALRVIPESVGELRRLTQNEPAQGARLQRLQELTLQKLAELETTIDLRRKQDSAGALAVVKSGEGKAFMDSIRLLMEELKQEKLQLFQERDERFHANVTYLMAAVCSGGGLAVLLVGLAAYRIQREGERRIREQQLAREYAENIIATLHEPLLVLDAERRVRSANRAFYQTFQSTPEATLGRGFDELGEGAWDPRLREALRTVIPEDTHFEDLEIEHVFPGIGRRSLCLRGRKVYRPGNHTGLLLLVMDDMTERRRAQSERDRFFRLSLDMLCIADKLGNFRQINPAFSEVLGYSAEEILARPFLELVHPEDRAATLAEVEKLSRGIPTLEFQNRYRTKDGSWRWLAWRCQPYPGEELLYATARDVTKDKEAEQEIRRLNEALTQQVQVRTDQLRREEQFNRLLLENLAEGVVACDAKGKLILFNKAARAWHGSDSCPITPDEWASQHQLFDGDAIAPLPAERIPLVRALSGEQVHHAEVSIIPRGAPPRFLVASASPLHDARGHKIGAVAVMHDITERKQAERTRRQTENRFRQLVELLPVGVYLCDKFGVILQYNQAAVKLWGQEPKIGDTDLLFCGSHKIFRPDGTCLPHDQCPMAETLRTGQAFRNSEISVERPDGSRATAVVNTVAIKDEQGEVVGAINSLLDITDRRKAEHQLRLSEFCLNFASLPTYWAGPEGRILRANRAACALLGYSESELLDLSVPDLNTQLPPDRWPGHWRELREKKRISFESTFRRKNGSTFPAELDLNWVEFEGREYKFVFLRDISGRRETERHMLRTQRLESLGTLAGGVAHDLNNALAPILMGTELLRMQHPGAKGLIDTMEGSARRGADMVRQLLTFAKGAEGERLLVQPAHLLKEMERIIKGTFPKNIELRTKYAKDLKPVLGDATQLHQVLLNLCVNARDAMPAGGTLALEAQCASLDATYTSAIPEAQPGDYLLWRVSDTGTGIPAEILDRIFEPFFSTKGSDKGTGLGLSTVRGIVASHGGFIQVQSAPGQGSTFSVYLPLSRSAEAPTAAAPLATEFKGNGEMVLIVDDEASVRLVTRTVLTALNFKVLTAADGTDALIQVADHRSDLRAVITDLHMPHVDGLSFVRALRHMLPNVGIVVASGRLEEQQKQEFRTLGVATLLEKPFTQETLVAALKRVFQAQTIGAVEAKGIETAARR